MTVSGRYPQGVPISIKYPEMPVHELWRNSARKFPDRPAALYFGARWTYKELWGQARSLASSLRELGVGRGDRVGLLLPNTPHFIVAYNAAHLLGAVVVALNPLMPAPEIGRELEETGCKVLVALDRLLDRLPEETPGTVLVAEAAHYAPAHLSALSRLRQRSTAPPGRPEIRGPDHGPRAG